jgi:hypothetical protein
MRKARREGAQSNPFQAALLSVAIVLIAIGLVTFGMATARAAPSPLYPDAATEQLPSLIWGGSIIAIGFVAFLFWLLVCALRWKPAGHVTARPGAMTLATSELAIETPRLD